MTQVARADERDQRRARPRGAPGAGAVGVPASSRRGPAAARPRSPGSARPARIVSLLGRSRLSSDRREHRQLRRPERVAASRARPRPAAPRLRPAQRLSAHRSVTLRPLTNRSMARTSATTASGTGCRSSRPSPRALDRAAAVGLASDRGERDVDRRGDRRPCRGGRSCPARRGSGRPTRGAQLDHEAVVPDLGEVRHVARADARPGDRDALAAGDTVTRISSLKSSASLALLSSTTIPRSAANAAALT